MRQVRESETANQLGLNSQPKVEQLDGVGGVAITTIKEMGQLPAGMMAGVVCLLKVTETASRMVRVTEDEYTNRKPVYVSWGLYRREEAWGQKPTTYTAVSSIHNLSPASQAMVAGAMTALAQELQSFGVSLDLDNAATPIPYSSEAILPQEI